MITKEYLHQIFKHDGGKFIWAVSPDGAQPIGTIVNTKPLSRGKPVHGRIRVRGKLFTIKQIEEIFEI